MLVLTPKGASNKMNVNVNVPFFVALLAERADLILDEVSWRTLSKITHGVSDTFRKGHVFLTSDASHVHLPVGGQGMNYGIAHAHNLLWKMAWAKRCASADPKT